MTPHSTYRDVQTGQAKPSAWDEAVRQIREAVAKRMDPVEVARRATVRTIKEQALLNAGVPLNQKDWQR